MIRTPTNSGAGARVAWPRSGFSTAQTSQCLLQTGSRKLLKARLWGRKSKRHVVDTRDLCEQLPALTEAGPIQNKDVSAYEVFVICDMESKKDLGHDSFCDQEAQSGPIAGVDPIHVIDMPHAQHSAPESARFLAVVHSVQRTRLARSNAAPSLLYRSAAEPSDLNRQNR